MDQQPRYNRILGYKPEDNRATLELAPGQYGSVAVINCAKVSAQDPVLPDFTKIKHSQWHSGRSIRVNQASFPTYHRNCMWFDVEIDKQYLDENAVTHVDTILRGNVSDNMIHSSIWWPVSSGLPDFTGPNTQIGPDRPLNPLSPDNGGPTIWIQTENVPADPIDGGAQNDVPVAIWSYSKIIGYTNPGTPQEEKIYDWEIIYGNENAQGLYNTTTINNIPTFVFNPTEQCRFVVQVHWNQNYAHTAIDREVALYVFKGDTDATRALNDYIVKSPIVRMRNQANPGQPKYDEPTQKGFKPAEQFEYYYDPRFKNLSIPITETEIVMDVLSGTATIDPSDDYENAVNIDLVGDGAELKLYYGPGSEAWVMAPVSDSEVSGNFPYYIGQKTQQGTEIIWLPTDEEGVLTLSGPGRYSVYGSDALLPQTPEIAEWLFDKGWPTRDYQPRGKITQHPTKGMLEDTKQLTNITSWQDILITTGYRMFRNVTGDFNLPGYQGITNLTEMFEGASDFTDTADALQTWLINLATNMDRTFAGCESYNNDPGFVTNNVTSFRQTFKDCKNFNTDINYWQTGSATDMFEMFAGCEIFNQPLGAWDTQNVTNMGNMFKDCVVYDQFIATWDVEQIEQKPPGFDTNTTSEWIEFEKPWWGQSNIPNSEYYVTLDCLNPNLVLKTRGPTSIKVFRFDKGLVTSISGGLDREISTLITASEPVAVFGTTQSLAFGHRQLIQDINALCGGDATRQSEVTIHQTTPWKIIDGDSLAVGVPKTQTFSYYTEENILADINDHCEFNRDNLNALLADVDTLTVLGDNNDWRAINQLTLGLGRGAFRAMGRLPNDLPDYLNFGYQGQPSNLATEALESMFMACSNIPDKSITKNWTYQISETEISLQNAFAFMPSTENVSDIIDQIFTYTQKVNAQGMFQGSVCSGIDLNNIDPEITSYKQTFRYSDLSNTRYKIQITSAPNSLCDSWHQAYMFSIGTDTFVTDLNQNIATPETDLSYEFAYTENVPEYITDWDFTKTSNISCMFYMSKFPFQMDNVILSHYNSGKDEQGVTNNTNPDYNYQMPYDVTQMPNYYCGHVFTGCRGNAQSMINWVLPKAKAIVAGAGLGLTYRDVLLPWWFAGCREFNTDISSWQTTAPEFYNGSEPDPVKRTEQSTVIRIGTFALCDRFNSQIDWYFPPEYYFDLSHIQGTGNIFNTDFGLATKKSIQFNTIESQQLNQGQHVLEQFDTMLYGRAAINHIWWRTFMLATDFNNGGQPLPTIQGTDMVDTFKASGIDQDVKIRKPIWGKAYYQGVFEDTTAWTAPRVIDFECQNRSDTSELENIYYHAIMAQRMFKNSTFMGTLGPGFKWFFYNVTNVNGVHFSKYGLNKEFMNWTDYTELTELRTARDNSDLDSLQTSEVTDSFGVKPVYNNKVMKTVALGADRAPQGNLTDTDARLQGGTGSEIRSSNTGLCDMTFPPEQERYMSYYSIRPLWTIGTDADLTYESFVRFTDIKWWDPNKPIKWDMRDNAGRSLFGRYHYKLPRTPVEVTNLSEMFLGATEFTQDLSSWRTRWSPPSGAFMLPEDAPGGYYWNPDTYYGKDVAKPQHTFNKRAEDDLLAIDNDYGLIAIVCEGDLEWNGAPSLGCGYLVGNKLSKYEISVAVNYHSPPNTFNCQTPVFETFRVVPGVGLCADDQSGNYPQQGIVNTYEILEPSDISIGALYKSTTSETFLVKRGIDRSQGRSWMLLQNPDSDISALSPGDTFQALGLMAVKDNAGFITLNNGAEYAWIPNAWIPGQEGQDIYDPVYKTLPGTILENGHEFNSYGNDQITYNTSDNNYGITAQNPGPRKALMDVKYTDNQATDSSTAPTFGVQGNQVTLYHAYRSEPIYFASQYLGPSRWPTWMVGFDTEPYSQAQLAQHFDINNTRDTGDSRYITNYAWVHEPYGWPDGDIYRNGEY